MGNVKKRGAFLSLFIVFLMLDSFFILPDRFVVPFPGIFRISDVLVFIVLFTLALNFRRIILIIQENKQLTLLVFCACMLFIITAIMANVFFNQSIIDGLIVVRNRFIYFLLFTFIILLDSEEKTRLFIKMSAILVFFLCILALTQKIFPDLPIFNYRDIGQLQYSEIKHFRFGSYRLFFPHVSFAMLIYFIILSDLLYSKHINARILKILFVGLFVYTIIATGTRVHIFSMLFVTLLALLAAPKKGLKIAGILLAVIGLSVQALSIAISDKGIEVIEESRLSQVFKSTTDLSQGSIRGRMFQNGMYLENFKKSPIFGVGTIRYNPNIMEVYKKHKFYQNNDLGYVKMLAEYGLVGIAWLLGLYFYVFKKSRRVYRESLSRPQKPWFGLLARGVFFFFFYIFISSLTLPHFIEGYRILPIVLSLVFLTVANKQSKRSSSAAQIA